MSGSKWKCGLGFLSILAVVIYFGVTGFKGAMMYYLEADELDPAIHTGKSVKVMGQVAEGSVEWLDHRRRVRFRLVGKLGKQVEVGLNSLAPDNFDEGRNVIVVGKYDGNKVTAKQVIVQCPSKYEAAEYDPTVASRGESESGIPARNRGTTVSDPSEGTR